MSSEDKTQLAMTEEAREEADAVQERAAFRDRQDLYRLAIAIAIRKNLAPAPESEPRRNYIGVGSLDPDGSIRTAVLQVRSDHDGRPYALAERLAEVGIHDMYSHFEAGRSVREYLRTIAPDPAEL
jgi:hypothetical protein